MRFLEALLLPLLCACSSDYSLGYLPQPEAVSVRTGGSPASDVFATDGQALATFINVPAGLVDVVATPLALGKTSSHQSVIVRPGWITAVDMLPTP